MLTVFSGEKYIAKLKKLRTVPTIVIAHTFCASRDNRICYRWCGNIFARFKAIRIKQNLASALGIQKENSG